MIKAYQITNWDKHYEVAQGRKCSTMKWFACPNDMTGNGFEIIAGFEEQKQKDILLAWEYLRKVGSTMPKRGLLVSDSGRALTAKNIAFRTRLPVEIFELALIKLCEPEIGWIERIEI